MLIDTNTSGRFLRERGLARGVVALGLFVGCNSGSPDATDPDPDDSPETSDEDVDEGPAQGQCGDLVLGMTPLRRLTAAQYQNTVRDLLGVHDDFIGQLTADEKVGPFKSNAAAPVGELQVEQYMQVAEGVAQKVMQAPQGLLECEPAQGDEACARRFIESVAPRAYRRAIEPDQVELLMAVYAEGEAEGGFENGIRLALVAMLQSPFFLYHMEFGRGDEGDGGVVPLTEYELASRLSYFVWNTMPDWPLFAAANAGELSTPEGLEAQVDRLLADPRVRDSIGSFHEQWLGVDEIDTLEKDLSVYPEFTPELARAMRQEVRDFANHVILEGDGSLQTLLTGAFTLTDDPELLGLYGVELPAGHRPGAPIMLDPARRSGMVTMAGPLAVYAHANQSSPVHRGVLVREHYLCEPLPDPPDDVDDTPPETNPDQTTRERFAQHTEDPACAGCHALIDGIGFGLENYDGIGAFRTTEGSLPIDASGELIGSDPSGTFEGGVELAALLAHSSKVQDCMTRQWFRYALGRNESEDDACSIDHLMENFRSSGSDLRALIKAVVLSDSFRFRRGPAVSSASAGEED